MAYEFYWIISGDENRIHLLFDAKKEGQLITLGRRSYNYGALINHLEQQSPINSNIQHILIGEWMK